MNLTEFKPTKEQELRVEVAHIRKLSEDVKSVFDRLESMFQKKFIMRKTIEFLLYTEFTQREREIEKLQPDKKDGDI